MKNANRTGKTKTVRKRRRSMDRRVFGMVVLLVALVAASAAQAGVVVAADFNDGTYGDLDTLVNVSDTSINTTVNVGGVGRQRLRRRGPGLRVAGRRQRAV
jgi:hypothetical protein